MNDPDNKRELARVALREAIRVPDTIATIMDFGPMSDANAATTLRQAYDKLATIKRFLDSLPRPPGFDEGN